MINVYEMQVFLEAAEAENFSAAGRTLHLSQPAVSQQIQALEQRLGVQLFQRQGRTVCLTAAGQVLAPMAREMIHLSQRIEESMHSLEGTVIGVLRIGCSTTSGKYILPHFIARFRVLHPAVRVIVEVSSQRSALEKLQEGRVNLAVSSSRPPHKDLVYQDFFTDEVVLIVPSRHSWASRDAIQPQELRSASFILREEASGTRQVMLEGLARHGISLDQLDVVMELGNAEAIEVAVEEEIGVAFVSRLVARRGAELHRIKEVPVVGLHLRRPISLAYHAGRPSTTAALAFWQFVYEPDNETLLSLVR